MAIITQSISKAFKKETKTKVLLKDVYVVF